MIPYTITPQRQPWVNPDGTPTPAFYRFMSNLVAAAGNTAQVIPITVTASPFVYTAPAEGMVIVSGGTVSKIEFSRDGTTFYTTGLTAGTFPLHSQDLLRVTYSVLPTMTFA